MTHLPISGRPIPEYVPDGAWAKLEKMPPSKQRRLLALIYWLGIKVK